MGQGCCLSSPCRYIYVIIYISALTATVLSPSPTAALAEGGSLSLFSREKGGWGGINCKAGSLLDRLSLPHSLYII